MGALATWGAVAGGAKVNKERLVRDQEASIAQEKASMDESRQVRLQKMRDAAALTRQEGGQDFTAGENNAGREFKSEERSAGEEFKSGEAENQRQFEAVQLDKKLASAESVAGTKAGASAKADKFKSVRLKTTIMGENGFPTEQEVPLVFQESTGQYFEDRAGQLVPYKLEDNISPGQQRLYQNPGAIDAYLKSPEGKRTGTPKWYKLMYDASNK